MKMAKSPNIKKWSDAKLDKEIAFARAAIDTNDVRTVQWLDALVIEQGIRGRSDPETSFDQAEKAFEENPSAATAAVWRSVAMRYWEDGMIGQDTFEYAMGQTFPFTGQTAVSA